MEVNNDRSGVNIPAASVSSTSPFALAKNLQSVSNSQMSLWISFKADDNTLIDFTRFVFKDTRQETLLRNRYKNYPKITISDYRRMSNYPDDGIKDSRPLLFDANANNVVVHGTDLEAVLKSVLNCNMQIAPVIKQFKLQGVQPGSGESAQTGTSKRNCRYVSVFYLKYLTSNFSGAIEYATNAASVFRTGNDNFFNKIPVVVVGDAIHLSSSYSGLGNEMLCKRLNIRLLAFKDEADKEMAMEWLRITRDQEGIAEINSIRFCTFEDLDQCLRRQPYLHQSDVPDIASLWEKSAGLE